MIDAVKIDLPYLLRDRDRHGNERIYYRRPGKPMVRLRAEPGTPEFLDEYRRAVEGPVAPPPPRTERPRAGTLRYLIVSYYESAEYRTLGPSTQRARRGILDAICQSETKNGHRRGNLPYSRMESRHVEDIRDEKLELPEAANGRVKALRQVFSWAISKGLAARDPAEKVRYLPSGGDGFHTWTPEEVRAYEERHPLGTKARLALALLLYTGVRRSDVVRLNRGMEHEGWLHFTEVKGGSSKALGRRKKTAGPKWRRLPILPQLREAIDAAPSGHMNYLVTKFGRPFSVAGFGNKFREWCDQAGLPHCAAHGLRKAGATIAAENGATQHHLMAIFGWESLKQAEGYTRRASRERLAGEAMHLLVPQARERNRP